MKPDINTLIALKNAGASISVSVGGGFSSQKIIELSPSDAILYIEKGSEVLETILGAPQKSLSSWMDSQGTALCMQTLKTGKQCGNIVGFQLPFDEYLRLHRNSYCHRHR